MAELRSVSRLAVVCGGLLAAAAVLHAESNILPERSHAWAPNLGWLNWRPDSRSGAQVGEFVCQGYLYSETVGWIHLGSGMPRDGMEYRNDSANDYGVNVDAVGNLRGLAYGANMGWIRFEDSGAPRIDLQSGALSGFAYGANVGWINLGETGSLLAVAFIPGGTDSDADGIPDAWELFYTGSLTALSGASDFDHDGQTDAEEYLADTDPTNPNDRLQVVRFARTTDGPLVTIAWTSKPTRLYRIESRADFTHANPWSDLGLGVLASEGSMTKRTFQSGSGPEYYRIRAVRPLSQ